MDIYLTVFECVNVCVCMCVTCDCVCVCVVGDCALRGLSSDRAWIRRDVM